MEPSLQLDRGDGILDPNIPYRRLVGILMWIARVSRPDIMYSVVYLAQFTNSYNETHFKHLKRIARYLHETQDFVLELAPEKRKDNKILVQVKTDSDWAADKNDRKSMSGACTFINGALFDLSAKKQTSVTTSSTEAEYCSGSEGAKDAKHALSLIGDITANSNVVLEQTAILEMDNQGACFMAKSPINNRRSRHIDIRFHFIRDYV